MNKLKTTVHVKKLCYYEAYQIKNILTTRYRFLKAMFYIAFLYTNLNKNQIKANKNLYNSYPNLRVDSFINHEFHTQNLQVIRILVEPQDAKMIESITLNRTQMEDQNGWHFTNNRKYTVQSEYQVEMIYPDKKKLLVFLWTQ